MLELPDTEVPEAGLDQLAQVLNEEETAPGMNALEKAPILGDKLLKVVEGEHDSTGAGSVQELQAQVEAVRADLEQRFHEVEERFRKQWFNLSFDEVEIEEDFRDETFQGQKKYMYLTLALFTVYSSYACFYYDVVPMANLPYGPPPNVTCLLGINASTSAWPLRVSRGFAYPEKWAWDHLASALVYRCALLILLIILVFILKFGARKLALAASVLVFWTSCILFDLAVANENAVYDIMEGMLLPQPRTSLPPLLFLMLIYTVGIPGIPFATASTCGWGVLGTSLISHLIAWRRSPIDSCINGFCMEGDETVDHFSTLAEQLTRVLLFNVLRLAGLRYWRRVSCCRSHFLFTK